MQGCEREREKIYIKSNGFGDKQRLKAIITGLAEKTVFELDQILSILTHTHCLIGKSYQVLYISFGYIN